MKLRFAGLTIIIIAVIFSFIETAHFGYNFFAQSRQENICDLISLFLYTVGIALIVSDKKIIRK